MSKYCLICLIYILENKWGSRPPCSATHFKHPYQHFRCYNILMRTLVPFIVFTFFIVIGAALLFQQKYTESDKNDSLVQEKLPNLSTDKTRKIPEMYKISLKSAEIDTRKKDHAIDSLNTIEDIHVIIQLKDPTVNTGFYDSFDTKMKEFGACQLGYVPNYAFLYKVNGRSLEAVAVIPEVNWIGRYYPQYKTSISDQNTENPKTIMYSNCGDAVKALDEIAKLGTLDTEPFCNEDNICTITKYALGQDHTVDELIDIESVIWVEEYMTPQLN